MEQHPVPQDITTYQFRLVGDMTLKQFIELASGIGLAILVFNIHLPLYVKWPLILFFALAGVAFAFLPIQGRPLDVWVKNFFKSIYVPTQFLWKKSGKLPDFFTYEPLMEKIQKTKLSPEERARFAEYLKSLPGQKSFSAYDKEEQERFEKINEFIQKVTGTKPTKIFPTLPQSTPASSPLPLVRVRKLGKSEPAKGQKFNLPGAAAPVVEIAQPLNPPLEIGTPWTALPIEPKPKPRVTKMLKPKPRPKPKPKCKITSVTVPTLSIPAPPELPNVVIGMVLDPKGKILPNAIIEVRDKEQMPVRASKTNKLGQFFMATPLPNGEYELETEYEPYVFDIIKFKTEGKIIPPIKIQARGVMPENLREESST